MMLNSYLPNACRRYAIAGLAIASLTPLAAFAGDVFVGVGTGLSGFDTLTSPLGLAALATPMAVTGLAACLGRRQDRLARQIESERLQAERLRRAAYHDSLTGLRNRHALIEDVERIVDREDGGPVPLTLMLMDLDRFKFINDTMGHAAGDAVLQMLAQRLLSCCGDDRRVYRLGGDEFVVLWDGFPAKEEITRFCDALVGSVFRPVSYGPGAVDTAGSIGIVGWECGTTTLSGLLKRADLALYRAKSKPGPNYCFFTEDMDNEERLRRELEAAMREGVANGAFEIDYLPVVKADTLSPSGFKARLRWTHPDRGDVAQNIFMPVAEGSGLIVLIGKWMLRRAFTDAAGWRKDAEITLPVSAFQLQDIGFAPLVLSELARAGVAAERLVLDVRSNSSIGDCPVALTNLEALRTGGVQIAVSELAASVAGLSMTRPYPVDRVRLDLGRIKLIAGEKRTPQMLTLFLQLAATVGKPVTLTGVDSEDDLQVACAVGPAEVQGVFAGAPLTAAQARQFFTSMEDGAKITPAHHSVLRAC